VSEYGPCLCEGADAAHARRVAAWAGVLGTKLGLPRVLTKLLEQAAELHHTGVVAFGSKSVTRVQEQVGLARREVGVLKLDSVNLLESLIEELVRPYAGSSLVDVAQLRRVLRFAHSIEERMEARPFEGTEWDEPANLEGSAEWGNLSRTLLALRPAGMIDIRRAVERIPLSPDAARQIRELSRCREVSVAQLERAASTDAVAAGLLLSAANSALRGTRMPITDLRQAVLHIGPETARRVLVSGMVRRLFASGALRPVWDHSLEAAAAAERLAAESGADLGGDAFLLGLLHDAGRLAMLCLPGAAAGAYQSLLERGVEETAAEMFLFGFDHGEAGATVLESWRMPEEWIEAVRRHHTPERGDSPAGRMLYLAEEACESEEDIPSAARLRLCLRNTGLTARALSGGGEEGPPWWGSLRFAA
jgi:HD-like signal output (HDOD) protein